jgi:serine phosphatase RsbU (regulator of sigma subunit)
VSLIRLSIQPPGGQASEKECTAGSLTFGRGADSDVVISDHAMSRHHARIVADEDGWRVEDLGARNGTYVNGTRIDGRQTVREGDVILMGGTRIYVREQVDDDERLAGVDLSSSIFRRVTDMHGEDLEAPSGTPSRVAARLKALNDFHRGIAGPVALDALLALMLDRLFAALHPEEGVILLRQKDGTLATVASRRLPGASGELLVSRRLVSEVVDKGIAALVSDMAVDDRFSGSQSIIGSGVRSILAAPISDAGGCIGMVAVYSRAHVRRFGEEDMELLVSLAAAAALRIRNVALAEAAAERRVQDHELALAHDIQMAMLPRQFPDRPEIEMGATLIPARAVGGDLYDFLLLDQMLWFIVADAAGKGVSAALFMAVTRTLFRAVAQDATSVGAVVERMNTELARDNERQFFVTAVVGRLDLRTGQLTYANAGHPAPLHARGGSRPAALGAAGSGVALGIIEGATYTEAAINVTPGDVLLVFTDGVTEAINDGSELYSDARLEASFTAVAARPAAAIVDAVVEGVTRFAGGHPQEDDITVLALRYVAQSS